MKSITTQGVAIPRLGFGTFNLRPNRRLKMRGIDLTREKPEKP